MNMDRSAAGSLEDPVYIQEHEQTLNSLGGLVPAPPQQPQPSNLRVLINAKLGQLQRDLINEQRDFEEYLAECLPDPGQMQNRLSRAVGHLQDMLRKLLRLRFSPQITSHFNRAVSQLNLQVGRLGEPYVWRQVSQEAFRLRVKQLLGKVQVLLQSYAEFSNLAAQIAATQLQQNERGIAPANVQQNGLGSTSANGQDPNWLQHTQSSVTQRQPQHQQVQPSNICPRRQQTQPSAIRHHHHHPKRQQRQSPYPPRGLSQLSTQSILDPQQRDLYFAQNQSNHQSEYSETLILGYSQEQQVLLNTYPESGQLQGSPHPQNQPMDIPLNDYLYSTTQAIELPPNSYHQPPNQAATLPVYSFFQPTNQFVPLSPNSNQHMPNQLMSMIPNGYQHLPDQTTGLPPNGDRHPPNQRPSLPQCMTADLASGLNEAIYTPLNGYRSLSTQAMSPPTNGYQPNQFSSLPPYIYQPPQTKQPSLPTPDTPSQLLHPSPSANHTPVQADKGERVCRKKIAAIKAAATRTNSEATPAPPAVPDQSQVSQNQLADTPRLATPAPPKNANAAEVAPETKLPAPEGWRPDMHYVFLWGLFMDRRSTRAVEEGMAKQFPELGQLGKAWLEKERERFWVEGDREGEEGRKDLVRLGVEVGPLEVVVVQLASKWAVSFSGGEVRGVSLEVDGNRAAVLGG